MAFILIGATAFTTEDAFAGKKNDYNNQAMFQANACGKGELPFNVGCQNTNRQLQGDENSCTSNSSTAKQEFPDKRNVGEIQVFQAPGESDGPSLTDFFRVVAEPDCDTEPLGLGPLVPNQ